MITRDFLLGVTTEDNLAYASISLDEENAAFTCSFQVCQPFKTETIDEDYVADYLDGIDKDIKYDMCEKYDCSPSQLPAVFLGEETYEQILDVASLPGSHIIDGVEWAFELISCGQVDDITIETYTDKFAVKALFGLWRAFHLVALPKKDGGKLAQMLQIIVRAYDKVDEAAFIKNFLKKLPK